MGPQRLAANVSAVSLVVFPLCMLAYWLLYPAYGLLEPTAILRAIASDPSATEVANGFALIGSLLAVPATLGIMGVLRDRAPWSAVIGGGMTLAGWVALIGVLVLDIVAVGIARGGADPEAKNAVFNTIALHPHLLVLNGLVALHIVGGVVLGIALLRTAPIPRWAGVLAAVLQPIHLGSNLAGILWLDSGTWILLAIAYLTVARRVLADARTVAPNGQ